MAKSGRHKIGSTGRHASRRLEVRRNLPKRQASLATWLRRPEFANASAVLLALAVVASLLLVWSRDQVKLAPGRIMTDTRLNRIDFTVVDEDRTEDERQKARDRAPDVYILDNDYLDLLRSPLANLPVVVAEQEDFEQIETAIRDEFDLDAASLSVLAPYAGEDGKPVEAWSAWVEELLVGVLPRHPMINSDDWQRGALEAEPPQLRSPDGSIPASWRDAIQIRGQDAENRAALKNALEAVVRRAGFPRPVTKYVAAALAAKAQPTYVKDVLATATLADQRAEQVPIVQVPHQAGDVLYRRGERLSEPVLATLKDEATYWSAGATFSTRWLPRFGILGLVLLLIAFAGGYALVATPRLLDNPLRLVAIAVLMTGMLAIAVVVTAQVPKLSLAVAVASTLFVAIVLLLAYDQRLALLLTSTQCVLTVLALELGVAWYVLLLAGSGAVIGQLKEVRHRNSLIRAAFVTAIAIGVGTVLIGLVSMPPVEGIMTQILGDAAWTLVAAVVVGFLVLGILPSIERMFHITTGMTLAELRDPSQPLLRQLQQRAPGTYNHSLQVANIAEAAADAIGGDSLLVYVGALYHDIGKMNKPEYFVENQAGGFNKHSKLRPAMSLLVIIGHVKDGIELAREYGLPRSLQHFIESHHGTTLVEYFYHAAKTEAKSDDKASVDEVEFRYPGPKPRTKEAALMMIADNVESATRAMTEPNPSRIESLVRDITRKRLLDGQFDDCDLTFRELSLIEDAVIARLCAIHHGRISYPTTKVVGEDGPDEIEAKTARA